MKNKNGIYIVGVDHGYGNIKTANCCFPTGVESSNTEPTFKNDLLIYQGRYYQIGVGHKEYAAEKVMDEDYYILTLAAIARELSREQITQGNVFLAAGLPLSWVTKQRKAFQAYLLQKSEVEFTSSVLTMAMATSKQPTAVFLRESKAATQSRPSRMTC